MEEILAKPEKIMLPINGKKVLVLYYSLWDGEEINVKERFRAWRSAATRNLNFSTNCPAAFCQTRVMG